jgi:hypothetical protein
MLTDITAEKPQFIRVLADCINLKQEVWLCAHEELRRSARMRFFWGKLEAALKGIAFRNIPRLVAPAVPLRYCIVDSCCIVDSPTDS